MTTTRITTETGSTYTVIERDGSWWFTGRNVPSVTSRPLPGDQAWEIERPVPWPPVPGERLWLVTVHLNDTRHPDRCPGGGKHTSPVIEAVEL